MLTQNKLHTKDTFYLNKTQRTESSWENPYFIRSLKIHKQSIFAMDVFHSVLVCAGKDNILAFYSLETNQVFYVSTPHKRRILSLSFSPNGKYFISGDERGIICLWDYDTVEYYKQYETKQGRINSLLWLSDTHFLSAGEDSSIQEWSINENDALHAWLGHSEAVLSLALTKELLASSSKDRTIKLWDLKTRQCIHTFYGHEDMVNFISWNKAQDQLISAGKEGFIGIWSPQLKKRIALWQAHTSSVNYVQFLADDDFILSTGSNNTLIVWKKEKPYFTIEHENWKVTSCFITKEKEIICADREGFLSFFHLP